MGFDLSIIVDYMPLFLEGAVVTAQVSVLAFVAGMVLAAIVAALSFLPIWPLRAFIELYLAVLRGVPFIILMFLVHYGMPFAGVRGVPAFVTGSIALSLFASAYYAESIRSAVQSLPRGQWESARVIGMSPVQAALQIIAPQILRPAIPPITNSTMTMIKETSILSAITVGELTYQGLIVQGNTFAPFEVFAAVGGIYWIMTSLFAYGARSLERRIGMMRKEEQTLSPLAARYLSLEAPRRARSGA